MPTLTVNGEPRDVPDGCTVAGLVELMGIAPERVAVERNGEVAPRRTWAATALEAGDRIEVVTFVGGG